MLEPVVFAAAAAAAHVRALFGVWFARTCTCSLDLPAAASAFSSAAAATTAVDMFPL